MIENCPKCGNKELIYHPKTTRVVYCPKCKTVCNIQVWSAESYGDKFWEVTSDE